MLLRFSLLCDQNTSPEHLRGGEIYYGLMVSEVKSVITQLLCSGSKLRQNIKAKGFGGGKLSAHRIQEAERDREYPGGQVIIPRAHPQTSIFFQPCPVHL